MTPELVPDNMASRLVGFEKQAEAKAEAQANVQQGRY
jgi:hypothetical protein